MIGPGQAVAMRDFSHKFEHILRQKMIKIVVFIASLFTIDLTGQPIKIRISNPYENYGKMKATTITVAIVTDKLPYSKPGIHGTMLQLSEDIHIDICRFRDY